MGVGGVVYATRIEPSSTDVTRLTLPLADLDPAFDGLTLAQVSDFHLGEWMTLPRMVDIADQVNALNPDVIAFTGDFASALWEDTPNEITQTLRAFRAKEAIMGVLGNHDHWTNADIIRQAIADAGNVRLLTNAHVVVQRGSAALYLAGVDDIWEQKHDLNAALAGIPTNAPTILLAHEPDYADTVALTGRIGLQLSGHSHGGQVRLPFKGALQLPYLGEKYDMGLYDIDGMKLYVNRGVGMVAPHVRFNCRPEITQFTLTSAGLTLSV
jgi:predicted MPP superfamily phosphohydrolase